MRETADWLISDAGCDRMGFDLYDIRHSLTAIACIVARFLRYGVKRWTGGVVIVDVDCLSAPFVNHLLIVYLPHLFLPTKLMTSFKSCLTLS